MSSKVQHLKTEIRTFLTMSLIARFVPIWNRIGAKYSTHFNHSRWLKYTKCCFEEFTLLYLYSGGLKSNSDPEIGPI